MSAMYPWYPGQNTSNNIASQTEATYKDYNKIKGFEDVGWFLEAYVVAGGVVTANITRNDMIDAADITVSLNNDIMYRDGTSFITSISSTTYYLDFTKEGDWSWGTSHPSGVSGTDYQPIAEVTTDSNKNVISITDARGIVGGFRLKDTYEINGYVTESEFESEIADINSQLDDCVKFENMLTQSRTIINGNFDVWQRGVTFTNPVTQSYMADRWVLGLATDGGTFPNIINSRQTLTAGDIQGSYYFYRLNTDGAGTSLGANSLYRLNQKIEQGTRYLCGSGKKVTVSVWARSTTANKKLGVSLLKHYGTGGSPSSSETINGTFFRLTGTWTKYTYTFTTNTNAGKTFGTNNDDFLQLMFHYQWGINNAPIVGDTVAETFLAAINIDIAQIQLCPGEVALPFMPKSFYEELSSCQRYYEKSYAYATQPATATTSGALFYVTEDATNAGSSYTYVPYRVPKRTATPTITVYGTGGTLNTVNDGTADRALGTGSFASANSEWGFQQDYTLTGATSRRRRFHFVADAEL